MGAGASLEPQNAEGARKQLLSCRHLQGERPQMDFTSKPHSPPGLLITQGLGPRLMVDPRAWNISESFFGLSIPKPRLDVGELLQFSSVDGWSNLIPFPTSKFVSWTVLSSSLCQHIPALFCSTLENTYKTGGQVCPPPHRQPTRNA